MTATIVLTISVMLQFIATVLALRLVRLTGRKAAWLLIAAAIALMGVRRSITMFHLLSGDLAHPPDLEAELVALGTSVLMVFGVGRIAPFFRSAHYAEEAVRERDQTLSVAKQLQAANQQLRATEQQARTVSAYARSLIEASLDPLMTIDKDGRITDVNEATVHYTGVPHETLIGSEFSQYFTEPEKAVAGYRQAFAEGFLRDYPLIIQNADGQLRDVLCNASLYRDAAGNVRGAFAAARDITERKRAEEALRESEARYHRLFEQTKNTLAETQALYCVSRSVIAFESLAEVLQTVVDAVANALPADRVTLITFDLETQQVTHFVKGGPGADQVIRVLFDELWHGLSGWVLRELKPALSPKSTPDPRESLEVQLHRAETNCGDIIVVPLRYQDKTLGTMTAINLPNEPGFTEHDVELMVAMARQAAMAIENARLYEELQLARSELEQRVQERTAELVQANASLNAENADRKRAEAALHIKDTAVASASAGIAIAGMDGRIQYVNPAWLRMHGHDSDADVLDTTPVDHIRHPADFEAILDVVREQGSWAGDLECRRRDGSYFVAELAGNVIVDSSGQPMGLMASFQDITARKQAETQVQAANLQLRAIEQQLRAANQQLRATEQQLRATNQQLEATNQQLRATEQQARAAAVYARSLIEASLDPLLTIDQDGRITDVNEATVQYTGMSREALIGSDFSQYLTEPEKAVAGFMQVYSEGLLRDYPLTIQNADGQLRDVLCNASLYRDAAGNVQGVLAAARDITNRKRAEKELRRSESLFRNLVNTIPDLIWLKDADGIYLSCNTMFERLFGAGEADILGKTDYDFVDKELADSFRENDRKAMAGGSPNINEEQATFADDGHTALLETTKAPMFDADGRLIGILGIGRDITQRKQAEEALKASERFLESTINGLSAHIAVLDEQGKITLTNKAYRDFAERNGADPNAVFEGANYLAVCDSASGEYSEEAHPFAEGIRDVLSGRRQHFELEYPCHSPDEKRWFFGRVTPIEGDGARQVIVAHENITVRKQAEAALHIKDIAVASASAGIAIAGMDERIQYVNPAWLHMHGHDSDADVLGTIPVDYIRHLADFEAIRNVVKEQGSWMGELECRRRDGSYFFAELATNLITDSTGRPLGLMVSFQDITERKQDEEQLKQNNAVNVSRLHLIEYSYTHSLDDLLEEAVNVAEQLTQSRIGFIHFVAADQQNLILQNWSTQTKAKFCKAAGKGDHYAIDKAGVWVDCVLQRKPVIHNDYNALPHKRGMPEGHAHVERELVVPVITGGIIKAILGVGNKPTDYTSEDVEVLSLIASLAWEIVERTLARNELSLARDKAEENFSRMTEAQAIAKTGNWDLDIKNNILSWSDEVYKIFGSPPEAFKPTAERHAGFIHPDDRESAMATYQLHLSNRLPYERVHRILLADRTIKYVNERCMSEFDEDGNPIRSFGTIADITEQWLVETRERNRARILQMLTENNDLQSILQEIVESIREEAEETICTILLLDRNQNTLHTIASAGMPEFYNHAIDGLEIGMGAGSCGTAAYTKSAVFVENINTHPYWEKYREVAQKANLTACWAEPIVSANDRVLGTFAIYYTEPKRPNETEIARIRYALDLTRLAIEKKYDQQELSDYKDHLEELVEKRTQELTRSQADLLKAKEAAEAANRAKSAFLANMSHEIRTPMNAILGFAQIIARDPALGSEHAVRIRSINRAGQHLLTLINDILDMAKIEAAVTGLNLSVTSLHDLLDDLLMMLRSRAEAKGLRVLMERDPSVPFHVRCDGAKLRQVLVNLIGNAIKFTQQGGVAVRVRTEPASNTDGTMRLIVEVEDSGPGISAEELDRIFIAFVQGKAGDLAGGTGLGLPISRRLAELMGGSLTVQSEVGKGSCFRVEVLIEPADTLPETENREFPRLVVGLAPGTSPRRILVVDDMRDNRNLLLDLLQSVGFEVREAHNGAEALSAVAEWSPHAVLMDMRMPVMDGYEATRRIKASEAGRETPVIAVTASAFRDSEAEILQTGVSAYLRKPFKTEEIFDVLGRCLNLKYVYATEPSTAAARYGVTELSPESTAALPAELRRTMREAVEAGDMARFAELTGQAQTIDPPAARALRILAERYDYGRLTELLAEGENAHE